MAKLREVSADEIEKRGIDRRMTADFFSGNASAYIEMVWEVLDRKSQEDGAFDADTLEHLEDYAKDASLFFRQQEVTAYVGENWPSYVAEFLSGKTREIAEKITPILKRTPDGSVRLVLYAREGMSGQIGKNDASLVIAALSKTKIGPVSPLAVSSADEGALTELDEMEPRAERRMLSVTEVADMTGFKKGRVRAWAKGKGNPPQGFPRSVRSGKKSRKWRAGEVSRWMEQSGLA